MNTKIEIWRVVTSFLFSKSDNTIAFFRRCSTMPTYPSHWAGISGTIEPNDDTPLTAALREISEETNLQIGDLTRENCQEGLYLDIPHRRRRRSDNDAKEQNVIIRVYPFLIPISNHDKIKLQRRGTEHDAHEFLPFESFVNNLQPTVPGLTRAFHHATRGRFLSLSEDVRRWEGDVLHGASDMTRQVARLPLTTTKTTGEEGSRYHPAEDLAILRPTMVPIITMARKRARFSCDDQNATMVLLNEFERDMSRAVDEGVAAVRTLARRKGRGITVATISRSSTITSILKRVMSEDGDDGRRLLSRDGITVATSVPGNEGKFMAQDLGTTSVDDDEVRSRLEKGDIDLFLFGADCVMNNGVVNKIGTKELATAAKVGGVDVYSCADRWKLWDDLFPPPMEDIFEFVPVSLIDKVIVPDDNGDIGGSVCLNEN